MSEIKKRCTFYLSLEVSSSRSVTRAALKELLLGEATQFFDLNLGGLVPSPASYHVLRPRMLLRDMQGLDGNIRLG